MNETKKSVFRIFRYTIVEMMMVIAVFMIILSMAMIAWLNSGDQTRLRNTARLVSGKLNHARSIAVAEYQIIKVKFTNDNGSVKMELVYDNDDKVPNSEPLYLPRGIFFADSEKATGTASEPPPFVNSNDFSSILPDEIKFKPTGGCAAGVKPLYIVGECTDGKLESGQQYFIVEINKFTGRINTIHSEVE